MFRRPRPPNINPISTVSSGEHAACIAILNRLNSDEVLELRQGRKQRWRARDPRIGRFDGEVRLRHLRGKTRDGRVLGRDVTPTLPSLTGPEPIPAPGGPLPLARGFADEAPRQGAGLAPTARGLH